MKYLHITNKSYTSLHNEEIEKLEYVKRIQGHQYTVALNFHILFSS